MSDYVLEAKVKNGLIVRAMRERGYNTVAALARDCRASQTDLGRLLNLKTSALNNEGEWRPLVIKLCECLHKMPTELFNQQQQEFALKNNKVERFIEAADIQYYLGRNRPVEELLEHEHLQRDVDKLLKGLTPRESRVIKKRFGLDGEAQTLASVGEEEGVQQERIRQIEAKALRKMRSRESGINGIPLLRHYVIEEDECEGISYEEAKALREENERRSRGDFSGYPKEDKITAPAAKTYEEKIPIEVYENETVRKYNDVASGIDSFVTIKFFDTDIIEGFEYIIGKAKAWGKSYIVKSPIARYSDPADLVRELLKQVGDIYRGAA